MILRRVTSVVLLAISMPSEASRLTDVADFAKEMCGETKRIGAQNRVEANGNLIEELENDHARDRVMTSCETVSWERL